MASTNVTNVTNVTNFTNVTNAAQSAPVDSQCAIAVAPQSDERAKRIATFLADLAHELTSQDIARAKIISTEDFKMLCFPIDAGQSSSVSFKKEVNVNFKGVDVRFLDMIMDYITWNLLYIKLASPDTMAHFLENSFKDVLACVNVYVSLVDVVTKLT